MQNKQHRPTGVTIIAILTIISGILLLLSGITLVALGALFSGNSTSTSSQAVAQFFGTISAVVGGVLLATVILLIIGIAIQILSTSVITASSLENTKNVISGIVGSITFPLIGIAINIVILYYLYRAHVKAYFGKAKPQSPTTM